MNRNLIKRVCIFCGSSPGARPSYVEAAKGLGSTLAKRGIGVVYGGARVGLMGAMADAALASGGEVIGVMPQALVDKEVAHRGLSQLHVVKSMHERKALMAQLSDAFVALPGGFGTLEEFFEVLTWAQLGLHRKPCALLNIDGFYDGLLSFADHCVGEAFVKAEHRGSIVVASAADALLEQLKACEAPAVTKWIKPSES